MAKKSPVMSHDPLSGLSDDPAEGASEALGAASDHPPSEVSVPAQNAVADASSSGLVMLPENLTIAEVGELRLALLAAFASGQSLTVDGSAVEFVDGAGMQLLAALAKGAAGKVAITWNLASDALQDAVSRLGLQDTLVARQVPSE